MELKPALGLLLLLFCLCMAKGASEKDPCTYAEEAFEHFLGMKSCGNGKHYWNLDMALLETLSGNLTVDDLRYVFTNHCSTVFPAMVQCFRDRIQSCSAAQRDYLTTVLDNTGFGCEPGTSNVHPYFLHLLDHLTDADLVVNASCRQDFTGSDYRRCSQQAQDATGLSKEAYNELIMDGTVQDALPTVSLYTNKYFECQVSTVRDKADRCPQWRGRMLRLTMGDFMPPKLGRSMTFTQQQLEQIFQFTDAASGSAVSA